MIKKIVTIIILSLLLPSIPLSFKAFDLNSTNQVYGRGDYLIVLASNSLESYLENEIYGGDFIQFKNSQGFNVKVISYDTEGFLSKEELKDYLIAYDSESNGMLEYVLLVGDVNGPYELPTFTVNSYNEEEIDVTDYPYSYLEDPYSPLFFIGRWSIQNDVDFLNIKSRSIQYVTNQYLNILNDDLSHFDKALLVAGNYKTAEGLEVDPSEWPVTPVWTSHWLFEELVDYGYLETAIDTAYFHQYNYQTATYNSTIQDSWNTGVGVINYRGWGDANGWHKPYVHREEVLALTNQWRMPVVMSFVCNTGDFGNDYIGTGLDKCFGEVLTTAGTIQSPKGAAAMVGPSDLDTDTRFNNVMCGVMWDGLLKGTTPEIAPALHLGKHALIDEFSGLTVGNTVIDLFYHHVYSVIGDPSLPVFLEKPKILDSNLDLDSDGVMDESLVSSHIVTFLYDEAGNPLEDVVGSLFKNGEPFEYLIEPSFDCSQEPDQEVCDNYIWCNWSNSCETVDRYSIYKGMSDSNGMLIIDFDLSEEADLELYLNKAQYLQKKITIDFDSDDGMIVNENISINIDLEISGDAFAVAGEGYNFDISVGNSSYYDIDAFEIVLNDESFTIESLSMGEQILVSNQSMYITSDYNIGDRVVVNPQFNSSQYNLYSDELEIIVSSNNSFYPEENVSPRCNFGYRAYDFYNPNCDDQDSICDDDSFFSDLEGFRYDWVEINGTQLLQGENLNLYDDTITTINLPFDFTYFGEKYLAGEALTICSNGWISFEPTDVSYFWNFSIPNPMGPSAMIAPFMDDLDDNQGTEPFNVWYYHDEGSPDYDSDDRLIVEWDNVSNGEDDEICPNCKKETFQVILLPRIESGQSVNGDIIFQYKEIWDFDSNGNYSTIGIESINQDDGVEYLFSSNKDYGSRFPDSGNTFVGGLAIKFTIDDCSFILMDINEDSIINVIDVVAIVNHIIGTLDFNSCELFAADVNGDRVINVVDILSIINIILSL